MDIDEIQDALMAVELKAKVERAYGESIERGWASIPKKAFPD